MDEIVKSIPTCCDSWLAQIQGLKQSIHNLKMRVPIGLKKIDDDCDLKLARYEDLLVFLLKKGGIK